MIEKTEFESGTFYLGDCFDVMVGLEAGSVDMAITSPPYDNLRSYNGQEAWSFDVFKPIADALTDTIAEGGVIVWNVGDATVNGSETGSSFKQALYFKEVCSLNLHDTMIFTKDTRQAVGSHLSYWQSFEYMFVFSKGRPKQIHLIKDVPNKYAGYKTKSGTRNKEGELINSKSRVISRFSKRNNVWRYLTGNNNGDDKIGHPAPFPIKMAYDHIVTWSDFEETVLDPFAGSGTTAIAAMNAGRRWICIEKDETYYRAAVERVRKHEEKMKEAA